MLIGILTKLASFSLRNPKLLLLAICAVAVGVLAIHYKMIVNERDKLEVAVAGYERAVDAFRDREASLRGAIENERRAAAAAAAARDEARRTLDIFREGRKRDPEAQEWAEQSLPVGEVERLCQALPEMDGCQ